MEPQISLARADAPRDPAFDGIRAELAQARHAPGRLYASAELLPQEQERIFLRHWNLACRSEQLAQPGDYLALELAGEPVLLSRTADGRIAAMVNACAHRGAAVASGCGNARRFVCPYHAWSYDLDGRLLGAPLARASGRDVTAQALRPLAVAEWQGWVFVHFQPDGGCGEPFEPFEQFIARWEPALWFYQAGQCRTAFTLEVEFACNWKLLTENVSDFYHAGTVHAASFGKQFRIDDGQLPLQLVRGGWVAQFDATRRHNEPNRFPDLPWLAGREDFAAAKAAVFPNVNIFVNRDSIRTSVFRPLAVDRTLATWWFLVPPAVLEDPALREGLAAYRAQMAQIAHEDKPIVESLQRAAGSRFYRPGPVFKLEAPVQHLIRNYLDVMGM